MEVTETPVVHLSIHALTVYAQCHFTLQFYCYSLYFALLLSLVGVVHMCVSVHLLKFHVLTSHFNLCASGGGITELRTLTVGRTIEYHFCSHCYHSKEVL